MSSTSDRPPPGTARLFIAAGVMGAEYLLLSHGFDAHTLHRRGGLWTLWAQFGAVGPLLICIAAAWYLLRRLGPVPLVSPWGQAPTSLPRWAWLMAHGVLIAAFYWVTAAVMEQAPSGGVLPWFAVWMSSGIGSVVTLLTGVLGGWRWVRALQAHLTLAAPVGLLAWCAGLLTATLWRKASGFTLDAAASLLNALTDAPVHVAQTEMAITFEDLQLVVSPGCGGYEGLGVSWALVTCLIVRHWRRVSWGKAAVLFVTSAIVAWSANVLRFAILTLLGARIGADYAVASFHSKTSWALFAGLTLGIVAVFRTRGLYSAPGAEAPSAERTRSDRRS